MNKGQIKAQMESEGFFGHDVIEILSTDFSTVGSSSLKHFFKFWDIHSFTELLGDSLDVINVDETSSVVVEKVEDLIDAVLS
jgi:hypothetical protein